MDVKRIDLNADLAEECGGDNEIFPCLSSANICCGAHAGGPAAMHIAVETAVTHGVTIGAHIGYDDRPNFGRIPVDIGYDELRASVDKQLADLLAICREHQAVMQYVKPHGALYHRVGSDAEQARAVVDAIAAVNTDLHLLVPNTPIINRIANDFGLEVRYEYFADRGYNADGTLVDRRLPGAMLGDVDAIVERALRWLETGLVECIEGHDIELAAHSICLHGDEPKAVASAQALRAACDAHGYAVQSWRVG